MMTQATSAATSAMFEAFRLKFGRQVQSVRADREDEIYLLLRDSDIRPITEHLRGEFGARLVTVFAEDRRSVEGVFFNYYVFEQKGSAQYLIVQAPVQADSLEFPALSAELPAVNWQEREIQDWFGLKAVGHPNPRRVALHDNWPDVYPLRKDFPLQTVLPPFEGERHIYRPAFGEGVLQVPVGPVHAGIIEPGHFNFAVAGEPILYLQLRMFYTHKGTEKLFERLPIHKAVFLAESISDLSRGTSISRWRVNPYSICSSECSTPTRARKNSSRDSPYTKPFSWRKAFLAIQVSRTAQLFVRPSNAPPPLKCHCAVW